MSLFSFLRALILDWVLILSAWALGREWAWGWILAAPIIAGRQHALFVLLHDGAHYRISKNRRINDGIANLCCGFPILMSLEAYRDNHLRHHEYTNTEKDPDWVRKTGRKDWEFPVSRPEFYKSLWRYGFGFGFLEMAFAIPVLLGLRSHSRRVNLQGWCRFFLFLLFVGGMIYRGWGLELFLFWGVPYFVCFPLFNRIRSVAEHFAILRTNELNSSRNVLFPNWIERLTLAPHGVHLHLVHHLFPSVCFYHLKKMQKNLMKHSQDYRQWAHQTGSYFWPHPKGSVFSEVGLREAQPFRPTVPEQLA